ncbi:Hypothetical predicted protein [Pelobates cultripes]|uniref:Uncharacterized protein n=1 Tax=Pelobates cultripes TaxID=61616 RepID=A0AAD1WIQ5_PELCU|nr:Hypothetical predicted protein [Pelobates cultripes]
MWKRTDNNRGLDDLLPTTKTLLQVWNKMKYELVSRPTLPLATPMRTIGQEIPTFPWDMWAKGEKIPKQVKLIIYHTLISANLVISRHWKKTMTPPIEDLVKQVDQNWAYEKMANTQFGVRKGVLEAHDLWVQHTISSPTITHNHNYSSATNGP